MYTLWSETEDKLILDLKRKGVERRYIHRAILENGYKRSYNALCGRLWRLVHGRYEGGYRECQIKQKKAFELLRSGFRLEEAAILVGMDYVRLCRQARIHKRDEKLQFLFTPCMVNKRRAAGARASHARGRNFAPDWWKQEMES